MQDVINDLNFVIDMLRSAEDPFITIAITILMNDVDVLEKHETAR